MSRRRIVVAGAVAGLLWAASACGVSPQDEAVRIAPESVPFGLLEATPSTTVVVAGRVTTVHLLATERLVPVGHRDGALRDRDRLGPGAQDRRRHPHQQ